MVFRVGDIACFNNIDSIYGLAITNYQILQYGDSDCTHVGIISKVNKDSVVIHEALNKGFVKNIYSNDTITRRIDDETICILRSKKKLRDVEKYCDKYLGRGYSWFDIFRIGITFILGFHLTFGCARHLICSEAVSRILYDASWKKLNLSLEYKKPYDLIIPQEIYMSEQLKHIV